MTIVLHACNFSKELEHHAAFFKLYLFKRKGLFNMQGVLWCSVCFYCPGFLQFSAILGPGIAAQSRLDIKEKDF